MEIQTDVFWQLQPDETKRLHARIRNKWKIMIQIPLAGDEYGMLIGNSDIRIDYVIAASNKTRLHLYLN